MKIIRLVEFIDVLEGGSTFPILIKGIDESDQIDLYVLKLFTKNRINENFSVAKEIFVNEFAKEFDLNVPDYALVNFNHKNLSDFLNKLDKSNVSINIDELDEGLKFCSLYKDGYLLFNPLTQLSFVDQYEIERLFAFDYVVMNADRGGFHKKPNLLIDNNSLYLIDHELTLPYINGHDSNFDSNFKHNQNLYNFNCEQHIFKKYLAEKRKKDNIFDEFIEYLKNCNINKFELLFDKMDSHNIKYGNRELILGYVTWAVNNYAFINKNLIFRISKNG